MYTGHILAKFHENILSLSENIAKSFRGTTFFDSHCIVITAWFLHPLSSTLMQHTNQAATHYDSIGTYHLSRRHIQYYDK